MPPAGPVYPGLHWHWESRVAPVVDVLLLDGQLVGGVDEEGQKKPMGQITTSDEPEAQ